MVTGFDIWGHDPALRRHWRGRFAALVIDAAIAFLPISVILFLLGIDDILWVGLLNSLVFYLVSSVPETLAGASIGKRAMGFKVHPITGESLGGKVCLRNIPRFFWFVLLPLDFAFGMATVGDPRDKLFDRLAGTRVVHSDETERFDAALRAAAENQKEQVGDTCQECGGKLMRLPDRKLQCEKCGVIQ